MNVQSTHVATTGDALTLMATTFAYVNQDGRPKTVLLVIKKNYFWNFQEPLPPPKKKILLGAGFQVLK